MKNLEDDFNLALNLCEKTLDTDTIIGLLKNGSMLEKQIAVLELNELRCESDAEILLNNLVGIDGKVRQAVAFKVLELIQIYKEYFSNTKFYKTYTSAMIDIDSNVCRLVISSIKYLKYDENFCKFLVNEVENIINEALDELLKLSFRTKKYTSNKQYFKIYWALEALLYFYEFMNIENLKLILQKCSKLPEYTVREKCAEISKNDFQDESLLELREILKHDENYFVRNV